MVISKAPSDAVRKGELARNVATMADPPSAKSTRAPEMSWWTPQELSIFLGLTSGEPLGPLFRTAAMTGMRRGEVCGLRWSDLDLETGRNKVRQQLLALRGKLMFSERTKTDRGRRRIDLDPATVAVLKAQWARQAEQRLLVGAGYRDHDLVFAQPDGSPLDPESVAKVFDRRVAKSKLPRLRFHDYADIGLTTTSGTRTAPTSSNRGWCHSSKSRRGWGTRRSVSRWTDTAIWQRIPDRRPRVPSPRWWTGRKERPTGWGVRRRPT
jgi:integrase